MKFSAQEEYGLRCLLAIASKGESMTIPEISRNEGLSEPHVAKLLAVLRKEEFITSTRGQSGGYTLARPPEQISVGHVLEALGGKLFEEDFCEKHAGVREVCTHSVACGIKSLWATVQGAVDGVLRDISLADLLPKGEPASVTFYAESPRRGATL